MSFQILLVEDEPLQRLILTKILSQLGCKVYESPDGETALRLFSEKNLDAILLDAMLPDIDGLEVCRRIRALPGGGKIPIVVVTALSEDGPINDFFAAGANDFLTKPVNPTLLGNRIFRLIEAARNQEALSESLAALEQNDRVRAQFAAMMAHDIRTPLTAMGMALEMVHATATNAGLADETDKFLDVLKTGIDRILGLSQNLIDVYGEESDEISMNPEVIGAEQFLHRCLLEVALKAREQRISLIINIQPGLPMVYGDARKLGKAFQNIFHNALKSTSAGGRINLSAYSEMNQSQGRHEMVVEISDSGRAVPESELAYLFDPFRTGFSVEGSLEYSLGLSLARRIIDQNHGQVSARSGESAGTTITIRLPLLPE